MTLATKATRLLDLHHREETLVLPNVWDAWSAGVVAEAGFPALAIGSHPLADSRGQVDAEGMTLDDAVDGVRRICGAVDLPVTADLESGYGAPPAELIERLLEAGAVGLNVEDTVHSEGGRLRSVAEHADYIAGLRAAADDAGVDLVINARTDVFIKHSVADPLTEGMARLRACQEAGARCLYPVGAGAADLRALLTEVDLPVNVIADPVDGSAAGTLDELSVMGVRRVTFGPFLLRRLTPALTDLVTPWH